MAIVTVIVCLLIFRPFVPVRASYTQQDDIEFRQAALAGPSIANGFTLHEVVVFHQLLLIARRHRVTRTRLAILMAHFNQTAQQTRNTMSEVNIAIDMNGTRLLDAALRRLSGQIQAHLQLWRRVLAEAGSPPYPLHDRGLNEWRELNVRDAKHAHGLYTEFYGRTLPAYIRESCDRIHRLLDDFVDFVRRQQTLKRQPTSANHPQCDNSHVNLNVTAELKLQHEMFIRSLLRVLHDFVARTEHRHEMIDFKIRTLLGV